MIPFEGSAAFDPRWTSEALGNVVNNGIKYTPAGGTVTISAQMLGDFCRVDVTDNGPGIPEKEISEIFNRFYRTDASRNSSKGGSGIGLSIVKKIVEEHGGNIWATSEEGAGTTMYFVIRKYQEVPIDE